MSKFKLISVILILIVIITFVTYNDHTTDIYIPFMTPMQVRVIFLLLIGFLSGSITVVTIVILDRYNNKKKSQKNMEQ